MIVLKSDLNMSLMAHETAIVLQGFWRRSRIIKWEIKIDAPDRIRGIWFLAQAEGVIPKHLADELEPYIVPIYRV